MGVVDLPKLLWKLIEKRQGTIIAVLAAVILIFIIGGVAHLAHDDEKHEIQDLKIELLEKRMAQQIADSKGLSEELTQVRQGMHQLVTWTQANSIEVLLAACGHTSQLRHTLAELFTTTRDVEKHLGIAEAINIYFLERTLGGPKLP